MVYGYSGFQPFFHRCIGEIWHMRSSQRVALFQAVHNSVQQGLTLVMRMPQACIPVVDTLPNRFERHQPVFSLNRWHHRNSVLVHLWACPWFSALHHRALGAIPMERLPSWIQVTELTALTPQLSICRVFHHHQKSAKVTFVLREWIVHNRLDFGRIWSKTLICDDASHYCQWHVSSLHVWLCSGLLRHSQR